MTSASISTSYGRLPQMTSPSSWVTEIRKQLPQQVMILWRYTNAVKMAIEISFRKLNFGESPFPLIMWCLVIKSVLHINATTKLYILVGILQARNLMSPDSNDEANFLMRVFLMLSLMFAFFSLSSNEKEKKQSCQDDIEPLGQRN